MLTSLSATSCIDTVSIIGVKRSKSSCPIEVPATLLALLSTLIVDMAGACQFVDLAPTGLGLSGATVAIVAFKGFFFVLLPDLAVVTTCVDMWLLASKVCCLVGSVVVWARSQAKSVGHLKKCSAVKQGVLN
jgi:hypothetical protein